MGAKWRAASFADLNMVVSTQVAIAEKEGMMRYMDGKIRVIISVDSTPIWHASATRGDIYVDCSGDLVKVGQGRRWATWFAMDGGDDCAPLRALDREGQLSRQVQEVQNAMVHLHPDGRTSRFECYLTGDGKGMQATNYKEGCRCWICPNKFDDIQFFKVQDVVDQYVRAGAFLGCIPPNRRAGDYVHCASRVVNAVLSMDWWPFYKIKES